MKKETDVYDLLALFHLAGIGLTPHELCAAASEVLDASLSAEVLERRIEKLGREVEDEERERLAKLLRLFTQTWLDLKRH